MSDLQQDVQQIREHIGARIRRARHAASLSQQSLADEVGVSKMVISKYEQGKAAPSSGVLLRLAKSLGYPAEYFLRPVSVSLSAPAYQSRHSLPHKQELAVMADVQEWLERYLDIEDILDEHPVFEQPAGFPQEVNGLDAVEQVAENLRRSWDQGLGPLDDLMDVLEARGIKVGEVGGQDDFESLALRTDRDEPVIAVRRARPIEQRRFGLAHELGHLVLKQPADSGAAEQLVDRFAEAFVVPASAATRDLGRHRTHVSMAELVHLRDRYGLSLRAWVQRARHLNIITESEARRLLLELKNNGWDLQQTGGGAGREMPRRMDRLVMRALAEDLISESRAAQLLGATLAQLRQGVTR
jgi:transcriptional regulator with XRE-family HTH domain/Zn-dependent peptidase ImmA (M78 family)